MKNLLLILLLISCAPACKKEINSVPVPISDQNPTYTPTATQYTLNIEYRIKTKVNPYLVIYNKFNGFDDNGNPIFLSISDSVKTGNDTIKYQVITSPFGSKYNYNISTQSNSLDSNIIYFFIDNQLKVYRPNYGQSYNFLSYSY